MTRKRRERERCLRDNGAARFRKKQCDGNKRTPSLTPGNYI